MHGKKRAEYKARLKDAKTAAAMEAKAQQWHALMKELQHRRTQENVADKETATTTLALLEKALLVNPDPLNLWNQRREVLLLLEENAEDENKDVKDATHDTTTDSSNGNDSDSTSMLERERGLTQAALQRNPKAYGPWLHRKWILQYTKPPTPILQQELALTAQFLQLDERNFHCWNYRRYVVACLAGSWNGEWNVSQNVQLMGPQVLPLQATTTSKCSIPDETTTVIIPRPLLQSEFDFTTSKIKDNFSNFSAFHYRSQLLEYIIDSEAAAADDAVVVEARQEQFLQEFQLLEDAICTEPDDQTAWWYHAILLDKLEADQALLTSATMSPRLQEQAELFRELLEDSPGKWVTLGLFRVLQFLHKAGVDQEAASDQDDEQAGLLQKLIDMDGDRSQRYRELLKQHQQQKQ